MSQPRGPPQDTLDKVIEKALRKKLPKLANTQSDKRILLLERQHMILDPDRIFAEIERQRPSFPELSSVDEIWIVETPFYGTPFGGDYLRFELYEGSAVAQSYDFERGRLIARYEHGVEEIVQYGSS